MKSAHNKRLIVSGIEVCDQLNADSLTRLFLDQTCVLRVPLFCPSDICKLFFNWLTKDVVLTPCLNEVRTEEIVKYVDFGVDSNSICFNTTYFKDANHPHYVEYYQQALSNTRNPRQISYPHISPIDRLRLELDELWHKGANIANFNDIKNNIGLFRVVQASRSQLLSHTPHVDCLPTKYMFFKGQFTANIYFTLPPKGGELEVWDVEPLKGKEIDDSASIQNWRGLLPEPIVIMPEIGELVLFNARRPHSVRDFSEGIRTSVQCFVGLADDDTLHLWS